MWTDPCTTRANGYMLMLAALPTGTASPSLGTPSTLAHPGHRPRPAQPADDHPHRARELENLADAPLPTAYPE